MRRPRIAWRTPFAACALFVLGASAALLAQDPPPKSARLLGTDGVVALDPEIAARNTAETPDPFPAPTAVSKPHVLVWSRVVKATPIQGTNPTQYAVTSAPFVLGAETVGEIFPTPEGSAFDPKLYSTVDVIPPGGGTITVVGNWRDLAAERAWALGRKVIDLRREIR